MNCPIGQDSFFPFSFTFYFTFLFTFTFVFARLTSLMTQGSAEEESNKRRSLRWRNRLSRSARQQDQQDQQLQRPEPSALNGSTSDNTSTSVVGGSDNVSMHSNGHPGDDLGDNSTMTKSQQVRNKELPILFKQVPPNDMLLRGKRMNMSAWTTSFVL